MGIFVMLISLSLVQFAHFDQNCNKWTSADMDKYLARTWYQYAIMSQSAESAQEDSLCCLEFKYIKLKTGIILNSAGYTSYGTRVAWDHNITVTPCNNIIESGYQPKLGFLNVTYEILAGDLDTGRWLLGAYTEIPKPSAWWITGTQDPQYTAQENATIAKAISEAGYDITKFKYTKMTGCT